MNRITDPKSVEPEKIRDILDRGVRPTVQFSGRTYSPTLLDDVNQLCRAFGEKLEVRFFGHYGDAFDASILTHLPDAQWLSVDCLHEIYNEDAIADLPLLRKLTFGVYRFSRKDFLPKLRLEQLKQLVLAEVERPAVFDLSSLERCHQLEILFLNGLAKNIEAVAGLRKLEKLSLAGIPNKQGLSFVNNVASLRALTLILGGRSSIEDDISHAGLEELSIIRVRGLETLGHVQRFGNLRLLHIEDQLQLRGLSVGGSQLQEISVHNCKNLEKIEGLDELTRLEHFRVSRTNLDLDALLARSWPASMRVVALYSGSEKWNANARKVLDGRGYREM